MLRKLAYLAIAAAVIATGSYYYQVRQIDKALDDISQLVAPYGRLDHGGASFSLSGEARINQLRFRPHGSHEEIRVERVAIRTGSPINLINFNKTLQAGRLPTQLGISLRGTRFPLDGPIFASMGEEAGNPGIAFDAAGCGQRSHFDGRDMASMGYLDFTGQLHLDYALRGDVDAIDWSMEIAGDNMTRFRMEASVGIGARSNSFQDLFTASESTSLNSVNFEFEDRGYYSKMLAFCADEMEMSLDEYVEHHMNQWQARWLDEGMLAGPEMILTYQRFLDDPGVLAARVIPTGNVLGLLERGVDISRLLGSMSIAVSMDGEEFGPLDLRYASPGERQAAAEDRPPASGGAAGGSASTDDTGQEARSEPQWQSVTVRELARYQGADVKILLQDGRDRSGRLDAVHSSQIILERRMQGGYMKVPIRYSEIEEVQVWQ